MRTSPAGTPSPAYLLRCTPRGPRTGHTECTRPRRSSLPLSLATGQIGCGGELLGSPGFRSSPAMETVRSSLPGEVTHGTCDWRLSRFVESRLGAERHLPVPSQLPPPMPQSSSPSLWRTLCRGPGPGTTGRQEKLLAEMRVRRGFACDGACVALTLRTRSWSREVLAGNQGSWLAGLQDK